MSTISLLERYGRAPAGAHVDCLVCRACGHETPIEATNICDRCFGPLEVRYDYAEVARRVSRERIEAGPPSIWRYHDLLPVDVEHTEPITLGEGFTPLVRARNLGAELGLRNLYLKNDTQNPTGSFKDRVVSVAATWAREHGLTTIACASTGNLANSVAAYAAHAGLRAVVVVPSDLEPAKMIGTSIFRPTLIAVDGSYDDVNRLCSELAYDRPWAFVNVNMRPYYAEGSKTIALETAEQLGWRVPDRVVAPIASGSLYTKILQGFQEGRAAGLLDDGPAPAMHGSQGAGCAPVATAFAAGSNEVIPVRPTGIAKSLAIGSPADGVYALDVARRTGGSIESVTDDEIVDGIRLLASTTGVFTETAGGVTTAVLRKLAQRGEIGAGETVVVYITGDGLKTIDAVEPVVAAIQVAPDPDAVDELLERRLASA